MKRTTSEDSKRLIPRLEGRPAATQRGGDPGDLLVTSVTSIVLVVGICCACAWGEMVTRRWGTPPSSSGSVRRPKPTGYAPRTDAPPKIDGQLDDACWAKAPAMVLDRTLDGNVKADVRTEVRAVRDDRRLYVAFRCAEPSAEALRAQRRGHDGEIWSDDSVEMFIGSGSSYHHFGVNAVGSTYDGWRKDRSWNSGLTAAAAQGKEEWTAELAIPLAKLTAAGKAERWIANFNRNRHAGGSWQEFAWSPTLSGDSHVPAQFGTLVFGSAPPKKPGAGDDAKVRFLPVAETEGLVQFDLSDLPAGTKVYRADLLVFRKQPLTGFDDEAMTDIAIYPIFRPLAAGEKIAPKGKPLALRGPWYDRFDATDAVRKHLADPGAGAGAPARNLAFLIKTCPFINLEATCLDVAYEGRPGRVPAQVTGVKALHRAGQTFITWREIDDPVGSDEITWGRLRDILANIDRDHRLRYCVYRSDRPITAKNLHDASLIARVRPLSCWNVNGRNVDKPIDHALGNQYVLDWHQWNPFRSANVEGDYGTDCRMERLVIEDGGKPLPRGTGLYVHTIGESGEGGRGYYAVVTCVDGVENTAEITAENTTPAVEEIPGVGEPVLQKVFPPKPYFNYREKRLHYVRWVGGHGPHPQDAPTRASGPPYGNLPCQYYNWGVGVPEVEAPSRDICGLETAVRGTGTAGRQAAQPAAAGAGSRRWPVELSLHRDGRSYYRTQLRVEKDSLVLSPHDFPVKTWWYGYHEALGTLKSFRQGKVHPYTERRLLAFIEWAASKWPIDRSRILIVGPGGGAAGSGALHLGVRHPDVFNLVLSGYGMADYAGEIRALTKIKRAGTFPREVQSVWGQVQWDLPASPARGGQAGQTARSVWEELDLTRRVRELPSGTDLPLVTVTGRGMTRPTRDFFVAMLEAGQPVMCRYGVYGGGLLLPVTRTGTWSRMIRQDLRRDQMMPAFWGSDASSLWEQPREPSGNLVVSDGIDWWWGVIGTDYRWRTDDIVDRLSRLEITLIWAGSRRSNKAHATVRLRRVQNFRPRPGYEYTYEVRNAAGEVIHEGKVTPGREGRFVFKGVPILREGSRLIVRP